MQELIIAVLGAIGLLVGIHIFDKYNVDKNQKKLEARVKEINNKQAHLEGEQEQEDKETQRKVDDIENEKNNKPRGSDLASWFSNRK